MSIIVKHRNTSYEYILLGINGEVGKANPSRILSDFLNQEKSAISSSATVCDVRGNIFLVSIKDLIVVEIDGQKLTEILPEDNYQSVDFDRAYTEEDADFEDEELAEEELAEEELAEEELPKKINPDDSDRPPTSFVYGQGSSAQSNVGDDDDEDWI